MRTKIIALLMLVLCLGTLISQTSDDWYQDMPIRTVTFLGLKNVSRSELDGLFVSYQGKKFNDELYWEILQKMYALEYFDEIIPVALPGDADRKTVNLQFTVKERPVIDVLKFTGNDKVKNNELIDKVTLKKGDVYNELKARMDERAIRDYYLEKGYTGVKILSEIIENEKKGLTLNFSIVEGKQTVISSILFEGNKVVASKTLQKAIRLKESKFLSSGTFQESTLESDKVAIQRYYVERGYVDARVDSVLRELDSVSSEDKNLLTLTFVIAEGDQFTYAGTTIQGNSIFDSERLLANIRLQYGDVMNQNRFDEGFQAIADVYFENGYTSNYITRNEVRDNEKKKISWTINIVESERSHIEHIIIKGNTKTKEHVISREILLENGDIFSKTKLLSSIRNINNLRYFSVVAPELVQGSENNLVDIILNLEEQSTASLQFGVTFSGVANADSFPLSVFLQWQDTNFLGNGQTLSSSLTASPDTQSLSLGYSENWFLGSPLTVSFDLSISHKSLYAYQDIQFPLFYDDKPIPDPYLSYEEYLSSMSLDDNSRMKYDQWSYSIGSSTGYRWNPGFATITLRGGINFSVIQNFYDDVLYRPADKSIRDQRGVWGWDNSIWSRISLDHRDLNYDPSSGWFLSQQITLNGIIPEFETDYFAGFETKAEAYITLLDYPLTSVFNLKFVLAAYSRFAFQLPYTDRPVSDSRTLYVDGMFVGRGWSSLYSNTQAKGSAMINHWLELRIPVAPGVLAFDWYLDAVAVKKTLSDMSSLSLNDYYFSHGPSLRFSIPQFPLRLMLANTFRFENGNLKWTDGNANQLKFVLSFNIANL